MFVSMLSSGHVYIEDQISRDGYWSRSRIWEWERAVECCWSNRWSYSRILSEWVSTGCFGTLCAGKR